MTPADIVRAINTEEQAVLKKFMALRIIAAGQVDLLQVYGRASGRSYISLYFRDGGVDVAANFDKPLKPEVEIIKIGDRITITGSVSDATPKRLVLDHCELVPQNTTLGSFGNLKKKIALFWREWLGKLVTLPAA